MILALTENHLLLGQHTVAQWENFEEDVDVKTRRVMWRTRLLARRENWQETSEQGTRWIWDKCQEAFEGRHNPSE